MRDEYIEDKTRAPAEDLEQRWPKDRSIPAAQKEQRCQAGKRSHVGVLRPMKKHGELHSHVSCDTRDEFGFRFPEGQHGLRVVLGVRRKSIRLKKANNLAAENIRGEGNRKWPPCGTDNVRGKRTYPPSKPRHRSVKSPSEIFVVIICSAGAQDARWTYLLLEDHPLQGGSHKALDVMPRTIRKVRVHVRNFSGMSYPDVHAISTRNQRNRR